MRWYERHRVTRAVIVLLLFGVTSSGCGVTCAPEMGPPPAAGPDRKVAAVRLQPTNFALHTGCEARLSARAVDAAGRRVAGTSSWSAVGPISIDDTGRFVATGTGTATITAAYGDVRAAARVRAVATPCPKDVDVRIDLSAPRQTMIGLEANTQNGSVECPREAYEKYREELWDRAIDEMGIDRVRLELHASAEHTEPLFAKMRKGDYTWDQIHDRMYEVVNDDADPRAARAGAFHFDKLDDSVVETVLPLKKRLEARGRRLYVNLCYVNFDPASTLHADPEEYAELVNLAFVHLSSRYGIVPDGLEIHLEPDLGDTRTAEQIARVMVAATRRLAESGWHPDVIAPSTKDMARAVEFVDHMIRVPGVPEAMTDLSFHRYGGVSRRALRLLARRADQYGFRTGMLEHMGSDHSTYEEDVTIGGVSTWTLLGLAFCEGYNGGDYYTADVSDPANPKLIVPKNVRYLPQYSRDVHRGAVRYETTTTIPRLAALAFANPPDGRHDHARFTAVVRSDRAQIIRVGPLPPGVYGRTITTATELGRDLGDERITNGVATITFPEAGVATIAGR